MSYDFDKWRDWLADQAVNCQNANPAFKSGDNYLPSFSFSLVNDAALGSFRGWKNALVDYEVFDRRAEKFVANIAMLEVDDSNFATVFAEFVSAFNSIK